ncbi:cupin domain-containing protein [Brevibacterium sp. SMBL_HHYL_HB1]|uniref:cupin domain-containing protein n=1 Tax=Brevibacterium sp. SMBL_HHYL_HB1 TaxID=2777556 RepID=UPI001BA7EF9F|nr:cupin domain-containing protein [Brevibacterium sp. SMBL_HHYL_HB1]QUL79545.1 cupin domain-containing protein [Brevibacterium sp. SMBL_HHYL_HB1]
MTQQTVTEADNSIYADDTGQVVPVVTKKGEEDRNTTQSGDCVRISGVSIQHTPATKIWYGEVSNEPGYRSLPHHHGEAETGGRILKGRGRIYFGEDYSEYVDMVEGDWVFVPPYMPHVEANMSTTEELVWITTRTPENIVVNLDDVPDEQLAGYRRA